MVNATVDLHMNHHVTNTVIELYMHMKHHVTNSCTRIIM